MFITSEHQPLGFVVARSGHRFTAETVVVALEGTKTIKHSKRRSSRITRLELRWSASRCSGLHRCCGACVVPPPLRPMSFRSRPRSRATASMNTGPATTPGRNRRASPIAFSSEQDNADPRDTGSSHVDQSESTDDRVDSVGLRRVDPGGISPAPRRWSV